MLLVSFEIVSPLPGQLGQISITDADDDVDDSIRGVIGSVVEPTNFDRVHPGVGVSRITKKETAIWHALLFFLNPLEFTKNSSVLVSIADFYDFRSSTARSQECVLA